MRTSDGSFDSSRCSTSIIENCGTSFVNSVARACASHEPTRQTASSNRLFGNQRSLVMQVGPSTGNHRKTIGVGDERAIPSWRRWTRKGALQRLTQSSGYHRRSFESSSSENNASAPCTGNSGQPCFRYRLGSGKRTTGRIVNVRHARGVIVLPS